MESLGVEGMNHRHAHAWVFAAWTVDRGETWRCSVCGATRTSSPRWRRLERVVIPWWQFRKRVRCPHVDVRGIYGYEVIAAGFKRLWCADCGRLLDGPVSIAVARQACLSSSTEGEE